MSDLEQLAASSVQFFDIYTFRSLKRGEADFEAVQSSIVVSRNEFYKLGDLVS